MSETHQHGWPKWLITVPVLLLALIALLATLPLTLFAAFLFSFMPAYRGAVRALLFLMCYLFCEASGVAISAYIWLRHRGHHERFLAANFRLQCGWASALMSCARRIFSLKFHIHNAQALDGAAVIMLPRHASIADTVLPMIYYAVPQNIRLRYVLKKELQWDPCLEIVGNRLPNYFVDRSSQNGDEEVDRVVALLKDTPPNEGLLLYPEGTRFSETKHQQLVDKAEPGSELAEQLKRWPNLLPPRLGGCLGLLAANQHHDLLFFAHSGFEGSANFVELMNGSWSYSDVHLEFWRVPFGEIPKDAEGQKALLFEQWDKMHQTVKRLDELRGL